MSRTDDNLQGNPYEGLLSGNDRDTSTDNAELGQTQTTAAAAPPPPPSHRKTRSLFSDMPNIMGRGNGRSGGGGTSHHRARSSIGDMLLTINEGVQVEAHALQETWKNELEEGDLGNRYFLDMNLTRSLSVLPEDITEFAREAAISLSERNYDQLSGGEPATPIPHTPKASFSSYAALLSAVLAVSSNGTALALLHDVHPALKLFWRMTAVAVLLSFFAIRTMMRQYREEGHFFPKLTPSQWFTFGAAALCFFCHTLLAFTALTLTSIGNAVIGTNSQALLLVLGKALTGQTVVFLEGAGVVLAFGGCILCALGEGHGVETEDSGSGTDEIDDYDDAKSKALLGDGMAVASAIFGVCYLTFAKTVRSHISVTIFMFMVMLSGCVLCFLYMSLAQVPYTLDNDPHTGLFGWLTLANQHIFIVIYIAVICNVVGTMGFVRAMEYFENIIIAVATLLEPLVATLIAYALGVGSLPGGLGWLGNFLVAIGTLGVVYPSINKTDGGGH